MKILILISIFFINAGSVFSAAAPENVLVVINNASSASKEIGLYYQKARSIPDVNMMYYTGETTETVNTTEYNKLVMSIKNWINSNNIYDKIDYIVLTKGTPLRRNGSDSVTNSLVTMDASPAITSRTINPYNGRSWSSGASGGTAMRDTFSHSKTYNGYKNLYLVTKLDGYTVEQVKALIDNSVNAYGSAATRKYLFDAKPSSASYIVADNNMEAASNVLKSAKFNNVIFDSSSTFQTGYKDLGCYFSWGSNDWNSTGAKYQSLYFAPGAIAETYVSTGGRTFEYPSDWPNYIRGSADPQGASQSLIADLVKNGVAGVSGYTGEPYLDACQDVETLTTRYFIDKYNLAESFYMSCPYVNWKQVLIGDPLCPLPPASAPQISNTITSSTPVNIYPQPFKPSAGYTVIHFTKLTIHTRLQIFNVAGELVYDEEKDTLSGEMEWNVLNSRGEEVSSGIYFYAITDENNNIKKGKLAILR
ncbi:MAG: TIGR03790 family protein [Candidatus Firestonebacteria bacterium]